MFGLPAGISWFASLALGVASLVLGYLIRPRPPSQSPEETSEPEQPQADPSMPIPAAFGTVRIKGLNVLAFTDLRKETSE